MGSIPRESKSWTWMQCKSLWIKASAKCINVNVRVWPLIHKPSKSSSWRRHKGQCFSKLLGTQMEQKTHRVWQGTRMMQGDTVLANTWQLRWQRWGEKHVRLAWLTHGCCLRWERKICHYLRSRGHRLTIYRSKIRTQRLTEGWDRAGVLIHRWNRTVNDFEGETWLVRVNIAF